MVWASPVWRRPGCSEWVNAKGFSRLAHIPLMGVNGDIQVEGKDWNMSMAAMGAARSGWRFGFCS